MKVVQNKRAVIVGFFISLGILILIAAVYTLGGQKKAFVKSFTINALFDDVNGLQIGNNVWFSGVKIGTIKYMGFVTNSKVLITMKLEQDAQAYIHKDAKAKISSDGLIGNKIVVIYGGSPTAPQVETDDYLLVEKAISTDDMLATLQSNNQNLLDILNNLKIITKKINDGNGTIGTLLNDTLLAVNIRTTLSNFKMASVKSEKVITDLTNFTSRLNQKGTLANDLVSDTIIFNNLKNIAIQLRLAANTANKFTDNIKRASDKLNTNKSPIGLFFNDDSIAISLRNTIKNMESSSKKLDEDLEALQHNFLFKGYFKKKE
ncbi:MlaD family protein [Solitalea koreensis]|uniref:Phospholipid/cholesterol/gamma-HCH transport system substrate-binding protein n=1 Tax=Solitalea koreensis TaxID=543615 RepID=A0A521BEF1_9SPHI|nr:MlaD family protein [Solitalea koreensis]SMO45439.1 phospholipid/cholesterol/gamma-HCH transport system substrate-binding protein [Solitalea koreensis]